MPTDDGVRLHDEEAGSPAGPEAGELDPQDSIPLSQHRPFRRSLQDAELMSQGEVLGNDDAARHE